MCRTIHRHECRRRKPGDHQDDRPLDQDADRDGGPENRRDRYFRSGRNAVALVAQIGTRHGAHRGHHGQEQHRIRLGEPRLDAEQERGRHHQTGQQRGAPRHESERGPVGQHHGRGRTDHGGDAIKADARARLRHAERFGGLNDRGLEPINADRLLVACLLLEADVDIIPGLDHLLGCLREPRLVPIHRRDLEQARQKCRERQDDQQRNGARMRRRDPIDECRDFGTPRAPAPLRLGDNAHSAFLALHLWIRDARGAIHGYSRVRASHKQDLWPLSNSAGVGVGYFPSHGNMAATAVTQWPPGQAGRALSALTGSKTRPKRQRCQRF